jgi:hypothetical protein
MRRSRRGPPSCTPMCATTTRRRVPIPRKFALLKEGVETHCPGMIVQLSTGGRSGAGQTRGGMLPLKPDMASLSVGSNNFPTRVYENPPDLVDWLASEMLDPWREARDRGLRPQPHPEGRRDVREGPARGHALRAVRHGREERHARRPRGVRLLRARRSSPVRHQRARGAPPGSAATRSS